MARCGDAVQSTDQDVSVEGLPPAGGTITISHEPRWPRLKLKTTMPGAHAWHWMVSWRGQSASGDKGSANSAVEFSDAEIANKGGDFEIDLQKPGSNDRFCIRIVGENPTKDEIRSFISTLRDASGFDLVLDRESGMRHFGSDGEPIVSSDNGYGIAQLTDPTPTYAEMWNWQLNIDVGVALFQEKATEAARWLAQDGRTHSADELKRETLSRWNGGSYYAWNGDHWERQGVLCDKLTSNIGWNMSLPENAGHSEAELHARDFRQYGQVVPPRTASWRHWGVCYAEGLLH